MDQKTLLDGERYLNRIKEWRPLPANSTIRAIIFRDIPDYHDDSIYIIELVGENGNTLWTYEQHGDYEIIWPLVEYLSYCYSCPITEKNDF